MEHLQYPIGKFKNSKIHSSELIKEYISELRQLPENIKTLTQKLSEDELKKTYREGSWTIKQLVHHLGESHLNCYIRIKLALTEDNPTIKPYIEDLWVKTVENSKLNPDVSVQLLKSIHAKIVSLAESLSENDLERTYFHLQYQRSSRISDVLSLYSWHGRHHLAHIRLALEA